MDFVDSFSNLHVDPPDPLVRQYYDALNGFLTGEIQPFLDLWHEGDDTVLYFNLNERERGTENIRRCFRQIQAVLSRAPVGVVVKPLQIVFQECGEIAYAVTMEQSLARLDRHTVVDEHRATLIWRKFDGVWKLVHLHEDLYVRRTEALSELLRSYHPEA